MDMRTYVLQALLFPMHLKAAMKDRVRVLTHKKQMQKNTRGLEISPSPKVCFSSYSPTFFDLILGAPDKHGGGLCFGRSIIVVAQASCHVECEGEVFLCETCGGLD